MYRRNHAHNLPHPIRYSTAMVNANVDLETQMKMSILGLFGSSVTHHGAYHLNGFAVCGGVVGAV